jgi:hypothetical protein
MRNAGSDNQKAVVKELKEEVAKLKRERDAAQVALAQMKVSTQLELDNKARLEKEIEMRVLIDAAYDKGYSRCTENVPFHRLSTTFNHSSGFQSAKKER